MFIYYILILNAYLLTFKHFYTLLHVVTDIPYHFILLDVLKNSKKTKQD